MIGLGVAAGFSVVGFSVVGFSVVGFVVAASGSGPAVVGSLLAAFVFSIASFLLAGRVDARHVGSVGLLAALSAGFGLYAALVPTSSEIVAVVVFLGFFAFLRLLSQFESIRR